MPEDMFGLSRTRLQCDTVICVGKINLGKMNWSTFAKPKISVAVEALWETQETT